MELVVNSESTGGLLTALNRQLSQIKTGNPALQRHCPTIGGDLEFAELRPSSLQQMLNPVLAYLVGIGILRSDTRRWRCFERQGRRRGSNHKSSKQKNRTISRKLGDAGFRAEPGVADFIPIPRIIRISMDDSSATICRYVYSADCESDMLVVSKRASFPCLVTSIHAQRASMAFKKFGAPSFFNSSLCGW